MRQLCTCGYSKTVPNRPAAVLMAVAVFLGGLVTTGVLFELSA
jgi:hypothetical protein